MISNLMCCRGPGRASSNQACVKDLEFQYTRQPQHMTRQELGASEAPKSQTSGSPSIECQLSYSIVKPIRPIINNSSGSANDFRSGDQGEHSRDRRRPWRSVRRSFGVPDSGLKFLFRISVSDFLEAFKFVGLFCSFIGSCLP